MELLLSRNETVVLDGDQRGTTLLCGNGTLWVTQAGDPRDYPLTAGQSLIISSRGRVVIWALGEAALRCLPPAVASSHAGATAKPACLILR